MTVIIELNCVILVTFFKSGKEENRIRKRVLMSVYEFRVLYVKGSRASCGEVGERKKLNRLAIALLLRTLSTQIWCLF